MLLPLAGALLLASSGGIPSPARSVPPDRAPPTQGTIPPLRAASGKVFQVVAWGPLLFKSGKKGYLVSYLADRPQRDTAGLAADARELALEVLRVMPEYSEKFDEGLVVAALSGTSKYNSAFSLEEIQRLRGEIQKREKTLHVSGSGWSKSATGSLKKTVEVERGQTYFWTIVLEGAGRDAQGGCHLKLKSRVVPPQGEALETEAQVNVPKGGGLPVLTENLRLDPGDPAGTYTLHTTVTDLVTGSVLALPDGTVTLPK